MENDEKSELRGTALERTRARKFAEHGIKYTGVWLLPQYTRGALAILKSGIFSGGELISSTGKRYSIGLADEGENLNTEMDHLLFELVRADLDYHPIPMHREILSLFDQYFEWMADIASLGGIQERRLKNLHQEFREKISERVVEGKIHQLWNSVIKTGEDPPSLAHQIAEVFLCYVPQETPAIHIAAWTNSVLIALGKEPDNFNTLRLYIGKRKKEKKQLRPISIIE